jgi:hypothetical protein
MKTRVIEPANAERMPDDEKERQAFRRSRIQSSRFLYNYFNPNLYDNSWTPNGQYIIKK